MQKLLKQQGAGSAFEVPFQLQIDYTTMAGMRCIRSLTQAQKITKNLQVAEQSVNMSILSQNARSQVARQAQQGDYRESQSTSVAWQSYMMNTAVSAQHQQEVLSYTVTSQPMNA